MTLYWFEHPDDQITSVPHAEQFYRWKNELSADEISAIHAAFDRVVEDREANDSPILTAKWLPSELCPEDGHEWGGTPFFPIWEKACRQNWQHTGWCFGLLLWEYMMSRDDEWICGKFDIDGVPIGGTTYFRREQ